MKLEVPQVLADYLCEKVSHAELWAIFQALDLSITSQANIKAIILVNPIVRTVVISVMVFIRINILEFHGSKFGEDPQEFVVQFYKNMKIMGVTPLENWTWPLINSKMFLKYGLINRRNKGQLMCVLLIGRNSKGFLLIMSFPLRWGKHMFFSSSIFDRGNMNVKDYALNFTQLFKYASTMFSVSKERMSKLSCVSTMVVIEYRTSTSKIWTSFVWWHMPNKLKREP